MTVNIGSMKVRRGHYDYQRLYQKGYALFVFIKKRKISSRNTKNN